MSRMGYKVGGLVLALVSTSALAFQEQGGAPPVAPTPQATQPAPAEKDLNFSAPNIPSESAGTEVRIPGLGKLGVLPKMDFGLELLYGASEPAKQREPAETQPHEDLTIRGTVKHNF